MDWNFLIGIGLLYLGTGMAYSQWTVDRFVKKGEIDKSLLNYLLWAFYKPIIYFRMKVNL